MPLPVATAILALGLLRSPAPRLQANGAVVTPLRLRHFAEYARGELQPARIPGALKADGLYSEAYALQNEAESVPLGPVAAWERARVAVYFGLWYALSVVYSVQNKVTHNLLSLPNCIATAQLLVGAAIAAGVWASRLRAPPRVSSAALRTLLPIGVFHGIGHLTGVYATAAGSVSFVQVVKSAGPVWACLLSGAVLRQTVSRRVWLSLLPICGGVGLASVNELQFVWSSFLAAAASDVALALRNVYSKLSMDEPQGENMTPANTFYTFTVLSCLFCLPITLALEWGGARAAWAAAAPTRAAASQLIKVILQSGLFFTLYMEVQFQALDSVSPVTHAIGNTMRRVAIMLVCIAVFRTPVSALGAAGSALAIVGSYVYAMVRAQEKQQADQAAAAAAAAARRDSAIMNPAADGGAPEALPPTGKPKRVEHPLLPLIKLIGKSGLCG